MSVFRRAVRRAAAMLLVLAAARAWAGPPFVTDDPEPVEPGKWEINSAITGTWGRGQVSAGAPSVDINYGALPGLQLHVQPRYSYVKDDAGSRHGLDDTEIGVKYRFVDVTRGENRTIVAIYPLYQVPTGAKRLGEDRGRQQVFLPLWVQQGVGKWTFYGGAGYRFNRIPEGKNSIFAGLTALYAVSERLQLGGEIFEESASTSDVPRTKGANIGGTLKMNETFSVLFSVGHEENAESSQAMGYLGLQARF